MEQDPLSEDIRKALSGWQPPEFWSKHISDAATRAVSASLTVEVVVPTPFLLGRTAATLELVDRVFRLATRAVETGRPVEELLESGAAPIPAADGLVLIEVDEGSGRFLSRASDRIYHVLQGKPVVFATAVMTALNLFGYEPRIVPQPPPPIVQPAPHFEYPDVTVIINVDGQAHTVRRRPPSAGLDPFSARWAGR